MLHWLPRQTVGGNYKKIGHQKLVNGMTNQKKKLDLVSTYLEITEELVSKTTYIHSDMLLIVGSPRILKGGGLKS